MDRQAFLVDALWSTSSSLAVASTSTMTTTTKSPESMCQGGALMGELAVPGAYSSVCMGLPERSVPLPRYQERMSSTRKKIPGTIVVQQKAGGSGNTGMTVWNSGLLMTRLLDVMVDELQRRQRLQEGGSASKAKNDNDDDRDNVFWRNQDVIELGCGTGLCSIAAHRLGAKSVVATDGNPRVLQLADSNIRQNCYIDSDINGASTADSSTPPGVPGTELSTIQAQPLQWGFLDAMDYSERASFIIGADLTYNPGSWRTLAETIATVLKTENDNIDTVTGTRVNSKRCYALYLSVGHDGFNVNAEMDGFLSVAKEVGLVTLPDGVEGIDLSQLLLSTLSDSEKRILAQGGGFRVAVLGRKGTSRK
eukprot:CAMPEP_0172373738 /NCGR_PEP_ID=MMETSP1060-20121228/53045_1 /TAXON_ID=37318 /ORGANISM="Pseudo-nitzschia pungens, Strain cf. cingulata" /LENGTH=364 /DNA_ID=CAMNT_0013100159 /DNA_START=122 /DNA_END=1216 /DNA_ORIENTATION=-